VLAGGPVDPRAMALAALAREREQRTEDRREVLLDVREDQVPDRRPIARGARDGVETRQRDECLRPGVRELSAQLGSGVQGVARDHDRARSQRAVERDDELRAVGQKQRDPVPFADAQRLEARGEVVREPIELGVRERSFDESMPDDDAEDRRDRPRMTRGGVGEELLERNGGVVERVRHAGVVLLQPGALGRDPDAQPQPPARYRSTSDEWPTNGLRFSGSYGSPLCGTSTFVMVTTASRLSDSIAS